MDDLEEIKEDVIGEGERQINIADGQVRDDQVWAQLWQSQTTMSAFNTFTNT